MDQLHREVEASKEKIKIPGDVPRQSSQASEQKAGPASGADAAPAEADPLRDFYKDRPPVPEESLKPPTKGFNRRDMQGHSSDEAEWEPAEWCSGCRSEKCWVGTKGCIEKKKVQKLIAAVEMLPDRRESMQTLRKSFAEGVALMKGASGRSRS